MICPFATVAGAASMFPVPRSLLVRDRSARPFAWLALLAIIAGWALYFPTGRILGFRIVLESLSVLALAGGAWRWAWWTRHEGGPGAAQRELVDAFRRTRESFRDPWILVVGVWLLAMIVMEWRGKTHFGLVEYVAVTTVFVGLIVLNRITRARRARFSALDSFATGASESVCPLGFGCAVPAMSETERDAITAAPERSVALAGSER